MRVILILIVSIVLASLFVWGAMTHTFDED